MKMSDYLRHLRNTGELHKDAEPMFAFYAGWLTKDAVVACAGDFQSEKFKQQCDHAISAVEFIEKAAADGTL